MPDLNELIEQIKFFAAELKPDPMTCKDTSAIKTSLVNLQDACAYAFTAIKQVNRTLPPG